jgi:hypothetical protein
VSGIKAAAQLVFTTPAAAKKAMENCSVLKNCTVVLERLDFTRFTVNLRPKTKRDIREYTKRKNQEYRAEMTSRLNLLRKCIPGKNTHLSQLEILTNATNYIQQLLNPNSMAQDQVKIPRPAYIKETKEPNRVYCQDYRKTMKKGYNLLQKWVPGTARASRTEILKKTVKYIQELEKTQTSQKDKDSAEALIPQEMAVSTPMEIPVSSEEEEKLLRSPDEEEEEFLVSPEEEMKLLASGEELPDFNCIEDLRQWLEL